LIKAEINRLIYILGILAVVLGVSFFVAAIFNGYDYVSALVFLIGIIVSNVPEGLLPELTVALTLTA